MKKSIYIVGAIAIIHLCCAILFKTLHWPGGNILMLETFMILIPLTTILAAIYLCRKEDEQNKIDE